MKFFQKHTAVLFLGAFLVASIALAAVDPIVELVNTIRPTWFQAGLYIAPKTLNPNGDTRNKITAFLGTSASQTFGALTITCADGANITLTGAKVGDACIVGVPTAQQVANISYSCFVTATNTVVVRACPAGTIATGGTGVFTVRVVSSQ